MKSADKEWMIERYTRRLEQHGVGIDALASGTEERRNMRFQVLTEVGIEPGDCSLMWVERRFPVRL